MSSNTAPKRAPKRQRSDDVADDGYERNAHKRQRCFQRQKTEIVLSPESSNNGVVLAKSPVNDKRPNGIDRKSSAVYTLEESSAVWALLVLASFTSRDLAKSPAENKRSNVRAGKSFASITSEESSAVWALLALASFASRDLAKSPADDKRSKVRAGKSSAIITPDESTAVWALLDLAKNESCDMGDKITSQSFSKYTFFKMIYLDLLYSTVLTWVISSIAIKKTETNNITLNCLFCSFSTDQGIEI